MTIIIHPIAALTDNYIWAIVNTSKNQAIIVDPGEARPVQLFLDQHQLQLTSIFITHHHWDHTSGVNELKQSHQIPVYGNEQDKIAGLTHPVHEHAVIEIEGFPTFKVLTIPGHTIGHVAYAAKNILFSGDTLFSAGCGRIFEGTPREMYQSLQKIAALSEDTHLYCGHEYTLNNLRFAKQVEPHNDFIIDRIEKVQTLRDKNLPTLPSLLCEEKMTNPFLRCDQPDVINSANHFMGRELTDPIEVFAALRKWKDGFSSTL